MNINELKEGDNVHYIPSHSKYDSDFENGVIKSISENGNVFVVYKCNGEWHNYKNYTGVNTPIDRLFKGWKY